MPARADVEKKRNSLALVDGYIEVSLRYDPIVVQLMKTAIDPRWTWDPAKHVWRFPAEAIVLKRLTASLGIAPEKLPQDLYVLYPKTPPKDLPDEVVDPLRDSWGGHSTPYRHQLVGLHELLANKWWLLAWDMGTGKSAVVAARLRIGIDRGEFGEAPILIVCPKSVCNVWPDQLAIHGGIDVRQVEILSGTYRQREKVIHELKAGEILVCNYEMARCHEKTMTRKGFAAIVCDESHRIKDLMSITNRAIRKISAAATYRWALSGTPAPNSPLDIAGTMGFLHPDILGVRITYLKARYALVGGFSNHQILGYKNLDELEMKVAGYSSRLLKEQAVDLPPKTFVTIPVELSREADRIYRDIRKDAIAKLGEGQLTVSNVLSESMRLLQVCGGFLPDDDKKLHEITPNAKLTALRDVIDEIGDKQAIIWAGFVAEVHAIKKMLGDAAVIHCGSLNTADRQDAIERFKAGDVRYFVSTPQSAREGITLTNADTVIYYSRTFNLLDWSQSQDRAHRIGQDKPVTIVSLMCQGTVEERVAEALERKSSLQEMILSGTAEQLF